MELEIYGVNNNLITERISGAPTNLSTRSGYDIPDNATTTKVYNQAGSSVVSTERIVRDSSVQQADFKVGELFAILVNMESIDFIKDQDKTEDVRWVVLSGQKDARGEAVTMNHTNFIVSCKKQDKVDEFNSFLNGNTLVHYSQLSPKQIYDIFHSEFKHISETYQRVGKNGKNIESMGEQATIEQANSLSDVFEIGNRLMEFLKDKVCFSSYDNADTSIALTKQLVPNIESIITAAGHELIKLIAQVGFYKATIKNGQIDVNASVPFGADHPIKTQEEYLKKISILSNINAYAENLVGRNSYDDKNSRHKNPNPDPRHIGGATSETDEHQSVLFFVQNQIEKAIYSVDQGAKEGGVNVEKLQSVVVYSILEKLKVYENKEYESLDNLYADHTRFVEMIQRKNLLPDVKDRLMDLLSEITFTKSSLLMWIVNNTDESNDNSKEPLMKNGVANQYKIDTQYTLMLGIPVKIKDDKRKKSSWIAKLSKATNEIIGYHPDSSVLNVINSYNGIRKLDSDIIQKIGGWIDAPIQAILPNWKVGENLTKAIACEKLAKAGEFNPKIIDLEEDIRNLAKWTGAKLINKEEMSREERLGNYKYRIERPKETFNQGDKGNENENPRNNPHLVNSGKDYSYLEMFGINEDFASAGAFAEGTGGTNQVANVIEPGCNTNMPGSISCEGNPHAPTRNDTPFDENGNKTSIKQSGSGDKFCSDERKKKKSLNN